MQLDFSFRKFKSQNLKEHLEMLKMLYLAPVVGLQNSFMSVKECACLSIAFRNDALLLALVFAYKEQRLLAPPCSNVRSK